MKNFQHDCTVFLSQFNKGHRFRPAYDFDYVALDLLGVYPEDSGVYTCQARNQMGEAVTSCAVKILGKKVLNILFYPFVKCVTAELNNECIMSSGKKDLVLESQYPAGLEKIQYLEDSTRFKRTELVDEVVNIRPRFITKPKNLDNMKEGQLAHFECKLEPVTDSNLKVEWFKNGHPIIIG